MLRGIKTSQLLFWMALFGMLTIAVIAPVGFFYLSYVYMAGSLESEAMVHADLATGIISSNPEMWELEQERLLELLSDRSDKQYSETRRILNLKNEVVAERTDKIGFPVMERRFDLMDSGVVVGSFLIQRSMGPLLRQTLLVGAASFTFGLVAFILIRVIPVRALQRKEEELRISEEKLRSLVTNIEKHHYVYQYDKDRIFNYISPSITNVLGYSPEEFMLHYSTYLTDHPVNESAREFNERCLKGEDIPPYELEIYNKDGNRTWLEVVEVALLDERGMVTGLQGVAQDISDRKKTEEIQLMQVQIETMRKLIRGLSHEIRNPLFGITSVSQILEMEIKDDKYMPMIRALNTESEKITRLIKELNMFVTPKTPVISRIDIKSFIDAAQRKCLEMCPQVNFKVTLGPALTLEGDEALLAYAIEEFLENSCQAGATEILIDSYISGEQVNLSIRDNGKGMSEKDLLACCEPFYTTKRGCSGLGLSLSKKFIELQGGSFNITSHAGEGTAISILL